MLAAQIVEDMLCRALVDCDDDVRASIMQALNQPEHFGVYLAQVPQLKLVCLALNDKSFAVKRAATRVATSLANLNPVHVLSALRKTTISWICDLRSKTTSAGAKEEVVRALSAFLSCKKTNPRTPLLVP